MLHTVPTQGPTPWPPSLIANAERQRLLSDDGELYQKASCPTREQGCWGVKANLLRPNLKRSHEVHVDCTWKAKGVEAKNANGLVVSRNWARRLSGTHEVARFCEKNQSNQSKVGPKVTTCRRSRLRHVLQRNISVTLAQSSSTTMVRQYPFATDMPSFRPAFFRFRDIYLDV